MNFRYNAMLAIGITVDNPVEITISKKRHFVECVSIKILSDWLINIAYIMKDKQFGFFLVNDLQIVI